MQDYKVDVRKYFSVPSLAVSGNGMNSTDRYGCNRCRLLKNLQLQNNLVFYLLFLHMFSLFLSVHCSRPTLHGKKYKNHLRRVSVRVSVSVSTWAHGVLGRMLQTVKDRNGIPVGNSIWSRD